MIIVTCAVSGALRTETTDAIAEHWTSWGNQWDFHSIDPIDPHAYGDVLKNYWEQGDDFAVIEPDIVIRDDVAEALRSCDCDYGCFPYQWLTHVGPALGCTWFRSSLLHRFPSMMREIQQTGIGWYQLDVVLTRHFLARDNGIQPHVHLPAVDHLNPRKQLMEGRSRRTTHTGSPLVKPDRLRP